MKEKKKIAFVVNKVRLSEADDADIFFWADKTWQDRVKEAERLRHMIWTHKLGSYPEKIEKVVNIIHRN